MQIPTNTQADQQAAQYCEVVPVSSDQPLPPEQLQYVTIDFSKKIASDSTLESGKKVQLSQYQQQKQQPHPSIQQQQQQLNQLVLTSENSKPKPLGQGDYLNCQEIFPHDSKFNNQQASSNAAIFSKPLHIAHPPKNGTLQSSPQHAPPHTAYEPAVLYSQVNRVTSEYVDMGTCNIETPARPKL